MLRIQKLVVKKNSWQTQKTHSRVPIRRLKEKKMNNGNQDRVLNPVEVPVNGNEIVLLEGIEFNPLPHDSPKYEHFAKEALIGYAKNLTQSQESIQPDFKALKKQNYSEIAQKLHIYVGEIGVNHTKVYAKLMLQNPTSGGFICPTIGLYNLKANDKLGYKGRHSVRELTRA
jgi:hypothetical protein